MSLQLEPSKKIQLLPEHLVDQIKAGEVVERPSALLKELLENSIDANSDLIDIHIIENGMELIKVEDNGEGMNLGDLPYAFCRHATSKISKFEDLYSLSSFGFRGEALASIASSSRVTCISSKAPSPESGGKIVIHGGLQKSLTQQYGKNSGTSLYIKDLFYNTPARLKFIKSKISEKNSLKRVLNAFMLSNPHINFKIKWDDSDKVFYKKVKKPDLEKRIKEVLFKKSDQTKDLIRFQKDYDGYFLKGYVSKFYGKGGSGKNHFLFINGRLFTDKSIHQTIIRSMEKIWPEGIGHYFISLTLPAGDIDVNVHPSKTLIKFNKPAQVTSLVSASIKDILKLEPTIASDIKKVDNNQDALIEFLNTQNQNEPFESLAINESDNLTRLTDNYLLINKENLLLNKNKLLRFFLLQNLLTNTNQNLDDALPLLIGEPFKIPKGLIDEYLPYLEKVLILIERIDEEVLILRAIPPFLESFPIGPLVQELLLFLQEASLKATSDNFLKLTRDFIQNTSRYGEKIKENELIFNLYKNIQSQNPAGELNNKMTIKLSDKFFDNLFE